MRQYDLRDLLFNKRRGKELRNLIVDKMIERSKEEAYMEALEDLRLKYPNLTSGVIIKDNNATLSNENEKAMYQKEYEILIVRCFEAVISKAMNKILARKK